MTEAAMEGFGHVKMALEWYKFFDFCFNLGIAMC